MTSTKYIVSSPSLSESRSAGDPKEIWTLDSSIPTTLSNARRVVAVSISNH
ncbi:hypothetical protein M422DRAFT_277191 [Sphaerobolus stellatus SS14]|uniref:Uncharacterized protein n=1 Tax=Sphaerobolus stellatus (strain SS14) TaxID=990650 RepID=A0A0C9T100_SPHS4|nr:hypothetical protein M422DRAFT_277191 [Sphaerobolus stellatus SS14]